MNIFDRFNRYRDYRKTVTELNSLSNRSLSDIGLMRSDIPTLAKKLARR